MMPTGRSVRSRNRGAVVVIAIALATLFVACGDNDGATETAPDTVQTTPDTVEATPDTVEDAARDARAEAEDAFATLRTEGERLLDQFLARNAPEAKQQLLDQCRNVLERLRKANSDQVGRVDALCNRIRDTDPSNASVWNEIKGEIANLRES